MSPWPPSRCATAAASRHGWLRPPLGRAVVTKGEDRVVRARVPAASGARYEAEGDPSTSFWSKGEGAMVTLRGEALPDCAPAPEPAWRAAGTEPCWSATLAGRALTLERLGAEPVSAILGGPAWDGEAVVMEGEGVALRMTDEVCRDPMTGRPYPETAEVRMGEETLAGCGGEPGALLARGEWVVEDLEGRGISDGARDALAFDGRGRAWPDGTAATAGSRATTRPARASARARPARRRWPARPR